MRRCEAAARPQEDVAAPFLEEESNLRGLGPMGPVVDDGLVGKLWCVVVVRAAGKREWFG